MEENQEFDAEFRVRLPSVLAEKIADAAKTSRRSRNQQYVFMLESWFNIKDNLEQRIKNLENTLSDNLVEISQKIGKKAV